MGQKIAKHAPTAAKTAMKETGKKIDFNKYSGLWYCVSRVPFEREVGKDVTETYTVRPDGKLEVQYRFKDGDKETSIKQLMWPLDDTNTHLMHHMPGSESQGVNKWTSPSESKEYHIIDISPDYDWSVVGTIDRQNFWIMSRKPTIDEKVHKELEKTAKQHGFSTSKLEKVEHNTK